jgi:hypothetical protein
MDRECPGWLTRVNEQRDRSCACEQSICLTGDSSRRNDDDDEHEQQRGFRVAAAVVADISRGDQLSRGGIVLVGIAEKMRAVSCSS